MKTIIPLRFLFFVSIIFTCSCKPYLQVTCNYDHHVNFHQFRTFAICPLEENLQSINDLNHDRILNAIKSEMAEKGFGESKTPDLLVSVLIVLIDRKTYNNEPDFYGHGSIFSPYGFGTGTASGTITPSLMTYKEGSLIVDEIDTKTGVLIWEGIGNSEFDKFLRHSERKIPAVVKSVMAGFPPNSNE
jgi:hypothetical protein